MPRLSSHHGAEPTPTRRQYRRERAKTRTEAREAERTAKAAALLCEVCHQRPGVPTWSAGAVVRLCPEDGGPTFPGVQTPGA